MFVKELLLAAIGQKLDLCPPAEKESLITPDVGALIRDRGAHVAINAAGLRRQIGFLNDVANCADFVLPKHRRRLKR